MLRQGLRKRMCHGMRCLSVIMLGLLFLFGGAGDAGAASFLGLGHLPGGSISFANGVSADGSAVVGHGGAVSGFEAFRWSLGSGMIGLGDLPGGSFRGYAFGTSADGAVVVGGGSSSSGTEAFRWTKSGGMLSLGDLAGGAFGGLAFGVSADGSVIVGQGFSALGSEAFIWNEAHGMRSLQDILTNDLGLSILTGWKLEEATGVSADGLTIVGTGVNPYGLGEAWVANLSPSTVPIPAAAWLFGSGLVGLVGLGRRR